MNVFHRSELPRSDLPGRLIQRAVGKDAHSASQKMTMGFARYSAASGPMEPHHHAEEIVYILDARDGWTRHGPRKDQLGDPIRLEPGMVLHVPELEWHVFGYGERGYVDIVYFYGQVENIFPSE